MIERIVLLVDYKGFFGSKQQSAIYRGGMDLNKLASLFNAKGFHTSTTYLTNALHLNYNNKTTLILYTSSEDYYGLYKSFIEDVVYHLEQKGYIVLPSYNFLKAHNNKVAMELLRMRCHFEEIKTVQTRIFGTLEELKIVLNEFKYPAVLKPASGAMSKGVAKADNIDALLRNAEKISRSFHIKHDIKEFIRKLWYKSKYERESSHRSKFIIQNMIEGLANDWKILIFGNKYYVLYRGNRKNDFRASGSGKFEFRNDIPEGMLVFAMNIKNEFNVPNISLDVGFDGRTYHLLEFQFLYFGTTTIEKSNSFFHMHSGKWTLVEGKSDLEVEYVNSIHSHIIDNCW